MQCKLSKLLAYSMAAYVLASVYYMIRSRSVGTPFNDSLTEEQKQIKNESKNVRKQIFVEGIILSAVALGLMTPFKEC